MTILRIALARLTVNFLALLTLILFPKYGDRLKFDCS